MVIRWKPVVRTVGVSLALGLMLFLGAYSAEGTPPPQKATEPEARPTAVRIHVTEAIGVADALVTLPPNAKSGLVEGIHMHGHWTIEVRDPDGTLVEHREFDNALSDMAVPYLVAVLMRNETVGGWRILTTTSSSEVAPGCLDGGSPAPCVIVESTDPGTGDNLFPTLNVGAPSDFGSLQLTGSFVAQIDGEVGIVQTFQLPCLPSISPDNCPGSNTIDPAGVIPITSTTLASPIAVLIGQQVQVNVTITFD